MTDHGRTGEPRHRAVAVVVEAGRVLVIRRERAGERYTVLPGGGVEPGESTADACLRELQEETGMVGTIRGKLPIVDSPATYYLVEASGTPMLGGPERDHADEENVYEPMWIAVGDLFAANLVPVSAVGALRAALHL